MRHRQYAQNLLSGNRDLRDQRDRRRSREVIVLFFCAMLVAIPLLCFVGFRMEQLSLRNKTEDAQKEIMKLREENRELRAEQLALESLERVEKVARERLALTDAGNNDVVRVYKNAEPAVANASAPRGKTGKP